MTPVRTTHGARSQRTVGRGSAFRLQSLLKPFALRLADLDPVTKRQAREWARLAEQVRLMDVAIDERGWLDEESRPPGFARVYFAARNSADRRLRSLEPRLVAIADAKRAKRSPLEEHLAERYGGGRR